MVGVGVALLHGLWREPVGIVGERVAKLAAPILGIRVQSARNHADALPLEYPVALQERVIGHVAGEDRHGAVEPESLAEALLHELQLRHVVGRGLRAAVEHAADLLEGTGLVLGVLCEQLHGEAEGCSRGLVASDHEVDDLAVEGVVVHVLPVRGLVLEHGADDGVLAAELAHPSLLDHLVYELMKDSLGLRVPRLQPGPRAEAREEALEAELALGRDEACAVAEAEAEVGHEGVGLLALAHPLHVPHVHAHTARDHCISCHGGEPVVHLLNFVPRGERRPLADEGPRLRQDLRGEALDLDLVEAARQDAVRRLPVLARLAAGEEAVAREVLESYLLRSVPELGELRGPRQEFLDRPCVR
mmetsp:Transcript_1201/g.3242  ORF Transcript_1201/g.3242 Transcript_1201/m.3242 type:complete len:360 (+) Transcript_1201:642-1721(+)